MLNACFCDFMWWIKEILVTLHFSHLSASFSYYIPCFFFFFLSIQVQCWECVLAEYPTCVCPLVFCLTAGFCPVFCFHSPVTKHPPCHSHLKQSPLLWYQQNRQQLLNQHLPQHLPHPSPELHSGGKGEKVISGLISFNIFLNRVDVIYRKHVKVFYLFILNVKW